MTQLPLEQTQLPALCQSSEWIPSLIFPAHKYAGFTEWLRLEGASGVHLVQAPSKAGCVLQCLVQDPLSLTCLCVFQLKMTVHVTHCCAVNEKCYLVHGLEGGGV